MSQFEVVQERLPNTFFSGIVGKITQKAIAQISDRLYNHIIPKHIARSYSTMWKEELKAPMFRYDIGETEQNFKMYWMPEVEPPFHLIDSLAKHFVKREKGKTIEIKVPKIKESLMNLETEAIPRSFAVLNSHFKNIQNDSQPDFGTPENTQESVFVESVNNFESKAISSPANLLKFIQNFKKSPRKVLKHSKSFVLRNFLAKPPIELKDFNKNISIIKIKDEPVIEEKQCIVKPLSNNRLFGNKIVIDNKIINKKEEEFRILKNVITKPLVSEVIAQPIKAIAPQKRLKNRDSFDKSGFDINGSKVNYKEVTNEDIAQNNFFITTCAERRGRSALPLYANSKFNRREQEDRSSERNNRR
jgi:hypothetical protein